MPLIAAFGVAAQSLPPCHEQLAHYETIRQRLLEAFADNPRVIFHLPADGVPYIIHLSVLGLRSETVLHFLAQRGVYVSSGSACAKGAKSAVLTALGLPAAEIDSALRVSLGTENTIGDMDDFIAALNEAMRSLAGR